MQYRTLGSTGLEVSILSQGGAAIGQQFGPIAVSEIAECVQSGIRAGINLIDTSAYYGKGRSEEILGEVLQGGWREKIYLCTKAGRLDAAEFDFSTQGLKRSIEQSLRRLRTDYVDILLAHDIEFSQDYEKIFTETADTLHQLKRQGKCRFIGMSGLPLGLLRQAIERCNLDVVVSYCHYHLQDQSLLNELLPVADAHGVGVLNASPLAMGLLTKLGPPVWHPASAKVKEASRRAADFCSKQGVDIAFLGMQYCFQEARIPSTITGTAKASELELNLLAMTTPIDRKLVADVQAILAPVMNQTWPSGNWQ